MGIEILGVCVTGFGKHHNGVVGGYSDLAIIKIEIVFPLPSNDLHGHFNISKF